MFTRVSLTFLVVMFSLGCICTARAEEEKVGRIDRAVILGKCGFGSYVFTEDNGSQSLVHTSIPILSNKEDGEKSVEILQQATSKDMLEKDVHERMLIRLKVRLNRSSEPDSETGLLKYSIKKVEKVAGLQY